MRRRLMLVLPALWLVAGCGDDGGSPDGGDAGDGMPDEVGDDGTVAPEADGDGDADGEADDGGPTGELIPPERRVDWRPGIPGGIPERTTLCANVRDAPYNARGDGTTDDASAIQAALDACAGSQGVVLVPAGTYRLTQGLALPSGVVLRGEGPDRTRLEGDGTSSKAILQAGSWDEADSPETAVVGGVARGSRSLVLASAAAFVAGDFVIVDQLNDDDLVRAAGEGADPGESPCSWGSRDDGTRLLGQLVELVAVDAGTNTVTIDPPLAMPLTAALQPELQRVRRAMTRDVGIEDLAVADRSYRGDNQANIRFWGVAYSWIRNVDSADVSGRHIQLTKAFRCAVRDSYVHHAHVYDPGANAYGIVLDNQTSECLVENCIACTLNAGLMTASCGPGNVLAYNYTDRMYERAYPEAPWLMADLIGNHCGHPFMALFEGNQGSQISADNIHGSSSHLTFFRNQVDRQHEGHLHTGNLTTVVFAANNRFMNVVGNVLGRPGDAGLAGAVYDQTAGNCLDTVAVYKLGYPSNCAIDTVLDPQVAGTLLRHGNYDHLGGAAVWDPAITPRELPPSLYLSTAPPYFGTVPWPPIGPDVDGLVHDLPAKLRFDELAGG